MSGFKNGAKVGQK